MTQPVIFDAELKKVDHVPTRAAYKIVLEVDESMMPEGLYMALQRLLIGQKMLRFMATTAEQANDLAEAAKEEPKQERRHLSDGLPWQIKKHPRFREWVATRLEAWDLSPMGDDETGDHAFKRCYAVESSTELGSDLISAIIDNFNAFINGKG